MIFNKNLLLLSISLFLCTFSMLESRSLNVLIVVEYFPAPNQVFVLNIITGLLNNGHNVSIFAFRHNDFDRKDHGDVEKYSLMDRVIYRKLPLPLPEYDIVFCQSLGLGRRLLRMQSLQKWLKNRKLVVALRGHDITNNSLYKDPSVCAEVFQKADLFLPVCDYFKHLAIQLGCPEDKIIVHHSGVDCEKFFFKRRKRPRRGLVRFTSVCRLVEKKGMSYAIQAIAEMIKTYRSVQFTIVGDGRLKGHLERLIKKLKIDSKVNLFGWGTHDQIINILDQSHIFLSPSITANNGDEEGIANSLKEAMAMGLITIATPNAGTSELIQDGISGFLVPERDANALAKKISYIMNNSVQWEPMGLAARKKIEEEFETKKLMRELEQLFYQLLDK
jgi:colanic acid/amylovoran biosynthesis glycosyltransferase